METAYSHAPVIPPRRYRYTERSPVSNSDLCHIHRDNRYTIICTTCIELMCGKCFSVMNDRHNQCSVSSLGDDFTTICEKVKISLSSKTDTMNESANVLLRSLVKKKERMMKKKNETTSEVQRYFQALRDKLFTKLQQEETALLNHLEENVAEQDTVITKNIEQCSNIMHALQENRTMVENFERIYNLGDGSNSIVYFKNLVRVANDINTCQQRRTEIEAARDAFLVIRFFVNSGTETELLNSVIACVEVLNSRSNNQGSGNLESERINEVLSNDSNLVSDIDGETAVNDEHELRVSLPPQESNTNSSNLTNQFADTVESSTTASAALTSTTNNIPVATISSPPTIPNSSNSGIETDSDVNTNASGVDLYNGARSGDDANINGSGEANTNNTTDEYEDLPPPYPGLPMLTVSPAPGELPPPYPGPPPPPYAQHPEPQQPANRSGSRGRLNSVSRNRTPPSPEIMLSPTGTGTSPFTRSQSPVSNVTQARGPLKTFSINEITDKRSSGIFAMAVYSDRAFLVIDRWNKKLKFVNDFGESIGGLIFYDEPWDIAQISVDLFAVTVPKLNTIYKVKASAEGVVTTSTMSTQRRYACLAYHSQSELFVCGQVPQFGEPVIDVIGINGGPILLSFRNDIYGHELFSYPRYVKVSNDGTVIVCDWNLKCLVVFKLDGTVVGRYRGTDDYPLNDPMGIELNKATDTIFVIDSKRNSTDGVIHKASMNCKCEAIYKGQNDFRDARTLAAYGEKLAVGNKNGMLNLYSIRERYR